MKPKLRFKEFTDDWEEKKLGEIGTFSKGKNLSKKDIDENGIKPCILYGELYTKYSEVINKVFSNTNVTENIIIGRKNDILIPSSGESPKEIAIASVLNIDNVDLGGDINIYKTDMNGFFISYFLRKNTKKLSSIAQGATVVHLYSNSLKNIKIQLPSLPEQEKIGTFLSLVDQRIEKAEKKVSLLKEEKKGWMQKLFQQEIRFKDEQGNEYPDWEEYAIQEIYKITRGKVLAKNKVLENGSYPVYSSQTLNNGLLGYYDEYLFENAITWTTDGANAGTVNFRKGKFYCTNVCGVLLNEKGYSNKCMAEISIQFPSLPEQEKIADFLSLLDQRIEKEERKVELLKEEKKGLLQNMFV